MNNIIFNQLQNITATELKVSPTDTHIVIPKTVKILNSSIKVGNVYDIELNDSILNPDQSSTLSSNWNNGMVPKYRQYTVEIIGNMSKMIKVNGVAIEDNTSQFIGWLPSDGFTILKKY